MKWPEPNRLIIIIAILLLMVAIGFFVLGLWNGEDFFANLATEFLSISITVLVIDGIYRWRDKLNEQRLNERLADDRKREIIEQMGSPVNDAALEAVRLAREKGWITDGSLEGANLQHANLEGAMLMDARLEGAMLFSAHLEGASLWFAHLEGAMLISANLEGACLEGANLEGADLGGVHLKDADLAGAKLKDAKLLRLAHLEGAKYDNNTTWPHGFDYKAAGVINVDDQPEN